MALEGTNQSPPLDTNLSQSLPPLNFTICFCKIRLNFILPLSRSQSSERAIKQLPQFPVFSRFNDLLHRLVYTIPHPQRLALSYPNSLIFICKDFRLKFSLYTTVRKRWSRFPRCWDSNPALGMYEVCLSGFFCLLFGGRIFMTY